MMPRTALVLMLFWFFSLFVFRSLVQWWQTGSTGLKGYSGAVGSLEWNGGLLTSLGMAAAIVAPVAALAEWPLGELSFSARAVHLIGAAVTGVGIVGALVAQLTMGQSWRIGVDEAEETALVTRGLYTFVRNPIFSFIFLSGLGLVLLLPNALAVLAVVLTVAGIEIQVRAVEEPYLRRVHGRAYDEYCARTGRFVPGVGRSLAER